MTDKITIEQFERVMEEADDLTKGWFRELERIGRVKDREMWEEVLLQLTIELQPTMRKMHEGRALGKYDQFLLDLLNLMVLPDPGNPGRDRDKALAMIGSGSPEIDA